MACFRSVLLAQVSVLTLAGRSKTRGRGRKLKSQHNRQPLAAAAKELNDLRERWLNPPEWTVEKVLGFPGTVGGPWDRSIVPSTLNSQLSTLNQPNTAGPQT